MSPEDRVELQRLLSTLCDDQLTPPERARLRQLLVDPECRRQYLYYIDLNAHLLTHPALWRAAADPSCEVALSLTTLEFTPRAATSIMAGELPSGHLQQSPERQLVTYALVVAATLAVSMLGQLFWWSLRGPAAHAANRAAIEEPEPSARNLRPGQRYVATLTHSVACVWEDPDEPWRVGTRLAPGELRFQRGSLRVHFDSGADLVIEGPADLRVRSSTSATLLYGKAVLHADEMAAPFDLSTPFSLLADLGTEYAVAVDRDSEEIHVFEGEVQRTARLPASADKPEQVKAGEARRFSVAVTPGEPVRLDPTRFVRWLPQPGATPADLTEGLLAYEGFDYPDPHIFRNSQGRGGMGWASPWMPVGLIPAPERDRLVPLLNVKESLSRPAAAAPSPGGCLDCSASLKLKRRLATPIRLDADRVYFLSFLFRRDDRPAHPANTVALVLQDTGADPSDPRQQLTIGVGGSNNLFTHLHRVAARTPLPLNSCETYLLVAKIAASRTQPDQVLLRVYASGEPIDREETGNWSIVSPLCRSDLVLDQLEVHIHGKSRQMIDEIRLGTTWGAVTSPWAAR